MVVLRCTQKLLARLKQTDNLPAVESTTRLGDWYGNVLQLGRRQHLLFISERSRFPSSFRFAKRETWSVCSRTPCAMFLTSPACPPSTSPTNARGCRKWRSGGPGTAAYSGR